MTWVLNALTSRLAGPVATAVAIALACFLTGALMKVGALKIEKAGLERKIERLDRVIEAQKRDLSTCRGNVARLDGAVRAQSAAVAAMKAEGDRTARALEKAARDAQAVAESHRKRADRFASARPQSCTDVSNLIDGAAR